jgi:GNAT superfamily N-acetyltransferase
VAHRDADRGPALSGSSPGRGWPISVRIARPEDREQVLSFATNTWDGYDYIPQVWDDWIVPSDGVVLVATVGQPLDGDEPRGANGARLEVGRSIAMTRVVMLSEDEAWLEGIRVDPAVRGLGVATDLQVAELRWIAAHGGRVVRYLTSDTNVGSLRLGAKHGLLEVGRWRSYGHSDDDVRGGRSTEEMEATLGRLGHAVAGAWDRVSIDPTFRAGHGLYEFRPWAFQELTAERFRTHVARGEVITATKGEAWAAVIVNRRLVAEAEMHIALAVGDAEALLDLLLWLGRPEIRVPDPDPPVLGRHAAEFAREGFPPWHQASVVVERPIDAAHPLPEADDLGLLIYAEEPRRIASPRVLSAEAPG